MKQQKKQLKQGESLVRQQSPSRISRDGQLAQCHNVEVTTVGIYTYIHTCMHACMHCIALHYMIYITLLLTLFITLHDINHDIMFYITLLHYITLHMFIGIDRYRLSLYSKHIFGSIFTTSRLAAMQ